MQVGKRLLWQHAVAAVAEVRIEELQRYRIHSHSGNLIHRCDAQRVSNWSSPECTPAVALNKMSGNMGHEFRMSLRWVLLSKLAQAGLKSLFAYYIQPMCSPAEYEGNRRYCVLIYRRFAADVNRRSDVDSNR